MNTSAGGPPSRSSSRIRAPEVAPVVHGGIRYEPLKAPSSEGLSPGIYLVATELGSGKRLWTTRLWETPIDPNRERDVQNVFLRSLKLDAAAGILDAEDERGRTARVSLAGVLQPPR